MSLRQSRAKMVVLLLLLLMLMLLLLLLLEVWLLLMCVLEVRRLVGMVGKCVVVSEQGRRWRGAKAAAALGEGLALQRTVPLQARHGVTLACILLYLNRRRRRRG
jgi:hypothetical protein